MFHEIIPSHQYPRLDHKGLSNFGRKGGVLTYNMHLDGVGEMILKENCCHEYYQVLSADRDDHIANPDM